MVRIAVISLTIVFCFSIGIAEAQNISAEAMHHFDRGEAAVEMAKSPADYEDAIKEFEQASTLAPEWPDVYYNLGLIQEKVDKYDDAIRSLTKYLELSPNASDSREVKKFIAKIEYKLEKKEGYEKVYKLMTSGFYVRKKVDFKMINGSEDQFMGAPKTSHMGRFRMISGKMQAQNPWYEFEFKKNDNYVWVRPRLTEEWVPVNLNGRFYEYEYPFYTTVGWKGGWYEGQPDYEVKGEIVSIDPPRVKETIKSSLNKGWPQRGTTRPFGANQTATAEYIFEWCIKRH